MLSGESNKCRILRDSRQNARSLRRFNLLRASLLSHSASKLAFRVKSLVMGIFPAKSPTMGKLPCRQPGDGQSSPPSRDDGQPSLPSARRWASFPAMQKAPVCSRSRGFLLVCSAHPNRLGLGASGDTLDGMPTGRLQPHAAEVRTTPSSRGRSQEPPDRSPWKTSQAPRSSA